jgi:DNA-binding response OmpR family regulator
MSAIVLIVDDNESSVAVIRTILLARGYEVRIARDGLGAIESVQQRRPDVILLDVIMPGPDGMQVLDRLKLDPKTTSIPVIMVTDKTEDRDVLAGYENGADYYITKPFTGQQLLYAIGLVLGGAEATD